MLSVLITQGTYTEAVAALGWILNTFSIVLAGLILFFLKNLHSRMQQQERELSEFKLEVADKIHVMEMESADMFHKIREEK